MKNKIIAGSSSSSSSSSINSRCSNMQSQESGCSKVPTLDLGELGVHHKEEPSQQEWQRVTRQLERALSDVGCAYLTGHGVPDDQVKEAFSSTIAFFKAKRNFKMRWLHDDGFVGYSQMSSEKYSDEGKRELHESFMFKHGSYDHEKEAPPFMTAVTPLAQLVRALSRRLMTSLALSLNKNRDYFVNMHQDSGTPKGTSLCRFNYYPEPTRGRESSTGFAAHRDLTTLTLLFSNDSEGFQICDPSGQWVDVPFVPGTILLLAGEFLHFYSNKRFIPVMHKVVVPSENHPGYRPRCSLIYFEYADDDTPMWPPGDDPASPDSPAPPSVKELLEKRLFKARVEGAKYTSS